MKKIIIFGNGQIAELAKFYFETDSDYEIVAFTADKAYITEEHYLGHPLIPFESLEHSFSPKSHDFFVAMSYARMNKVREAKVKAGLEKKYTIASYISSKATYLSQFRPGMNSFILENNTIQPFVQIGDNVTMWSGNHIGHHSIIKDNNFISSHVVISGNCTIKQNCFIGVNATLHNDIVLEKETLVAAGAIIQKSSIERGVYLAPQSSLYKKSSDEIKL